MSALVLGDKAEDVKQKIVDFVRAQCTQAGYGRAVLGLSGGVDSALVAYLCAEALGKANVYGIRLPCDALSPASTSMQHAMLAVEKLGIWYDTISVSMMAYDYFAFNREGMDKIRRGNFVARLRMAVLYDLSKEFDALVVSTSNKTETLLGYTTLYGDSAGAFQPIGDLYKTQVFELARYVGVPDVIVEKAPSADLWPGQTDEDELGWSYEEIDRSLQNISSGGLAHIDVFSSCIENDLLERVIDTGFKRCLPPVCEVQSAIL